MRPQVERALESWCASGLRRIGQILIQSSSPGRFVLCHRDDASLGDLKTTCSPEDAAEIVKHDDAENYRPLKTAPNLRHGWRMELSGVRELQRALDLFYPGRLTVLFALEQNKLATTPLRVTLDRQSGMYRIAARISDAQIDDLVGEFCRSDDGCLRTILWKRDRNGAVASTRLPPAKFDPAHDQVGRREPCIPLLCQEACNLLVSAARKVVKNEP